MSLIRDFWDWEPFKHRDGIDAYWRWGWLVYISIILSSIAFALAYFVSVPNGHTWLTIICKFFIIISISIGIYSFIRGIFLYRNYKN